MDVLDVIQGREYLRALTLTPGSYLLSFSSSPGPIRFDHRSHNPSNDILCCLLPPLHSEYSGLPRLSVSGPPCLLPSQADCSQCLRCHLSRRNPRGSFFIGNKVAGPGAGMYVSPGNHLTPNTTVNVYIVGTAPTFDMY